jgi:hypothetical protein
MECHLRHLIHLTHGEEDFPCLLVQHYGQMPRNWILLPVSDTENGLYLQERSLPTIFEHQCSLGDIVSFTNRLARIEGHTTSLVW